MLSNISKELNWLQKNNKILKGIKKGIERETLRIEYNGNISPKNHPKKMGSSLTNKWITTDFSESLMEFITPAYDNINKTIFFLQDIHNYVSNNLIKEYMWPFSMPGFIKNQNKIEIANYGTSNIAKIKKIYREGLKNRYGVYMNIMSGIHYNFSFPKKFWKYWFEYKGLKKNQHNISNSYMKLIRNYYRFGWIIPYLFGASPAICSSFLKKNKTNIKFIKNKKEVLYLPWATSLRLSEIGYNNKLQKEIKINFNSINYYIKQLKLALNTPIKKFKKFDVCKNKIKKQLNCNILQMENELYTQIRPKVNIKPNQIHYKELLNKGIEYIEIRSLDVNPFSSIGINKIQMHFLEIFIIWCMIGSSKKMNQTELNISNENWNRIILEGRKPKQIIKFKKNKTIYLKNVMNHIIKDLYEIAEILDDKSKNKSYTKSCNNVYELIKYPELTYSNITLKKNLKYGMKESGLMLAEKYFNKFKNKSMKILKYEDFIKEIKYSNKLKKEIENQEKIN
ncbi:Glutamate--cysteine ligase [Buchnera aphidicola (Neophyllaphis podocarpi)]|uniref:glutamate--cysteine ligase n=1 Tax=Buchnera aphidicola TaxID=9 RepID=UPI0031B839E6